MKNKQEKLKLPQVTLAAMTSVSVYETVKALQYSMRGIEFPSDGKMHCFHDIYGNWVRVGNSVGLRSKRLLEFPRKANLEWTRDEEGLYNEDIFLCCRHKHDIEAAGMKLRHWKWQNILGMK